MKRFRILLNSPAKEILRRGLSFVNSHPRLRQHTLAIIQRLGLYTIARAFYSRLKGAPYRSSMRGSYGSTPADLSPRARQIYANLKAAIEHKQRENG